MQEYEEELLSRKFDAYGLMLFRLCVVISGNRQDAEDAVQETFVQYWNKRPQFADDEHEKAWLIRVATNKSKDRLRSWFRRSTVGMDALNAVAPHPQDDLQANFLLEQLAALPYREKAALYLHCVEGYKITEIGSMLKMSDNAVKAAMYRGRQKLKLQMKEVSAE